MQALAAPWARDGCHKAAIEHGLLVAALALREKHILTTRASRPETLQEAHPRMIAGHPWNPGLVRTQALASFVVRPSLARLLAFSLAIPTTPSS